MNCQELKELLHPYLDRELGLDRSLEVEQHLQQCGACARAYQQQQWLHSALSQAPPYLEAPRAVRKSIRSAVRAASKAQAPSSLWLWRWLSAWAPLAAAALVLLAGLFLLVRPFPRNQLPQELMAAQVRSLMTGHLIDVVSSDQHTVKPWFNDKLDFSPPVINLAADGYPLVGGRLDYINGRAVAVVVYQRQKHYISLFLWPAAEPAGFSGRVLTRQGYHLLHWTEQGMNCWAVSDISPAGLREFAQLVRGYGTGPAAPPAASAPGTQR